MVCFSSQPLRAFTGAALIQGALATSSVGFAQAAVTQVTATAEPPALFTQAQAAVGATKYASNCQQCHGPKLQGRSGPALTGPNFANAKANFKVGDIFTFMANAMPATQPGSLPRQDYADILAFMLQKNNYPAGDKTLTADAAQASTVPLLYRSK